MVDPPVVTAAGEHKRKAEDEADEHRDKAPAVAATAEDAPRTAPQTKPAPFTTGFAGFASASSGFGAAAAGTGGFAGFASVAAGSGFGGFGKGTGASCDHRALLSARRFLNATMCVTDAHADLHLCTHTHVSQVMRRCLPPLASAPPSLWAVNRASAGRQTEARARATAMVMTTSWQHLRRNTSHSSRCLKHLGYAGVVNLLPAVCFRTQAACAPPSADLTQRECVSQVTGEEDEETVFSAPAALFAFEAPEAGRPPTWRERGKGELRVNCAREGTRARMVMRSAGNLRLILNAVLFTAMHVSIMDGGKGVTFSCANAAEGSVRQEKEAQPDGDGGKEAGEDGQPTAEVHMFAVRLRSADAEARVFELKSAIESALAAQSSRGKEEGEAPHEV